MKLLCLGALAAFTGLSFTGVSAQVSTVGDHSSNVSVRPEVVIAKTVSRTLSTVVADVAATGDADHRYCLTCRIDDTLHLCCLNFPKPKIGDKDAPKTATSTPNSHVEKGAAAPAAVSRVCKTPWPGHEFRCAWMNAALAEFGWASVVLGEADPAVEPIPVALATGDDAQCFTCHRGPGAATEQCCVADLAEKPRPGEPDDLAHAHACFYCQVSGVDAQCCDGEILIRQWLGPKRVQESRLPDIFIFQRT